MSALGKRAAIVVFLFCQAALAGAQPPWSSDNEREIGATRLPEGARRDVRPCSAGDVGDLRNLRNARDCGEGGGMNLDDYCRAAHGPSARAMLQGSSGYDWRCSTAGDSYSISMEDVCRRQYGGSSRPVLGSHGNPYSWSCQSGGPGPRSRSSLGVLGGALLAPAEAEGAGSGLRWQPPRWGCVELRANTYGAPGLHNSCGEDLEVRWYIDGSGASSARIGAGSWFPVAGRITQIFACPLGYRYNEARGACAR